VSWASRDYSTISRLNGKPTAIIAIYQLPGSNALQTAEGVRKLMAGMKDRLPEDVDYANIARPNLAGQRRHEEVVETLVIAILLVILVVYLFLQDWRATLIPMLAVPVSLVWHVCPVPAIRLLNQHTFDVGPCPGNRSGG